MKQISPIYFYGISLVAFVLANLIREKSQVLYFAFLIVGVLTFFFGLFRRLKGNR